MIHERDVNPPEPKEHYEPDPDAQHDEWWLRKKEEEEQQQKEREQNET